VSGLECPRGRSFGIEAVAVDCLNEHFAGQSALANEAVQRRQHDGMAIHLEESPQRRARITAPEAVGSQSYVYPVDVRRNELRVGANVVRRRHGHFRIPQLLFDMAHSRRIIRVQPVPAMRLGCLPCQFAEAGHTEHLAVDTPILLQESGCKADFAHRSPIR